MRVFMRLDKRSVYQKPMALAFAKHRIEDVFPYALVAPAAKATVDIVPVSVARWQIPIWGTCAKQPKYCVYKLSCVFGLPAFGTLVAYGMRFNQGPQIVGNIVSFI